MSQPLPLDQAVEALKRDPTHAVRARVGDMTVDELRAVSDPAPTIERAAADALREVGVWEGETYDELVTLLAGLRESRGAPHRRTAPTPASGAPPQHGERGEKYRPKIARGHFWLRIFAFSLAKRGDPNGN